MQVQNANNPATSNALYLGLPPREIMSINGIEYDKEKIISKIYESVINSGISPEKAIYIHGSNSSSIRAVKDGEGLLSARELHNNDIPIEGGEHTDHKYKHQYDDTGGTGHKSVFLSKFDGFLDDDVKTYMSYNTINNRYPVLYVISGDIQVTRADASNYIISKVPSRNIIGLLVPKENLEETRSILPENRRNIVYELG